MASTNPAASRHDFVFRFRAGLRGWSGGALNKLAAPAPRKNSSRSDILLLEFLFTDHTLGRSVSTEINSG